VGPWASLAERRAKWNPAEHKGRPFVQSGLEYFLESCPVQARAIAAASGKLVICPSTGEVF
jgi:hypothetical protein